MTLMIYLKNSEEIAIIKEGGAILSEILAELVREAGPGVMTDELDKLAERRMIEAGGKPAFKGYKSDGDTRPFPSTVCISLNNEVVHAPATPARKLKDGDLLKMDIGLEYKGLFTDMAVTVPIGEISDKVRDLVRVTRESLFLGIEQAQPGNMISDIGKVIDGHVQDAGFSTVKALVGHGVGKFVHEEPRIPNYVDPELEPVRIEPGMVLALEPMVNLGTDDVALLPDEWTVVTADEALSAHFEVTIAITEQGPAIMTPLPETE